MSIEAAGKFVEKVVMSEALRDKVSKATSGKDGLAVAHTVAEIGKAEGFDFTAEEAVAISKQAVIAFKQNTGQELSAAELDQVSGGVNWGGIWGSIKQGPSYTKQGLTDFGNWYVSVPTGAYNSGIKPAAEKVADFFKKW
ncbi:MAG: Nif11-like leader peptide family natural product precursor [Alphaproteobacteria bacterium]|nr:Nif11-like leader peptide family natural product precursor [Alphaproteobacteria bacterium]